MVVVRVAPSGLMRQAKQRDKGRMMASNYLLHDERFCPGCGYAGVVVALDGATLIETRPEVRRHACGIGGPGSSVIEVER